MSTLLQVNTKDHKFHLSTLAIANRQETIKETKARSYCQVTSLVAPKYLPQVKAVNLKICSDYNSNLRNRIFKGLTPVFRLTLLSTL